MLQQPPPRRAPEPDRGGLMIRAAALGIVAAVLFGVLFFRLWALQVLRADHYVAEARQNDVRQIGIPPPRGRIVDSAGRVLVNNELGVVAQVDPAALAEDVDCTAAGARARSRCEAAVAAVPAGAAPRCKVFSGQQRCRDLARLGKVLGFTNRRKVWDIYERPLLGGQRGETRYVVNAGSAVTIAPAQESEIAYVMERRSEFPGVRFLRTYQRVYPWGRLAPNVLGYVGNISQDDLENENFADLPADAVVGKEGVEYTYDRWLRGEPGLLNQSFDASGRAVGEPYLLTSPTPGNELRLTIDARLQQVAQKAILDGISIAHEDGEVTAREGAVVAMDPDTGAVLAMASWPTYDPSVWVPPYKGRDAVLNDEYNLPGLDRTTQGLYAPGSTFKPFTAAAAWWAGMLGPGSTRECTGTFRRPGDTSETDFDNWDTSIDITVDLPTAIEISCDTFFYRLGNEFYDRYLNSTATDQFPVLLRRFGFGSASPIDLPGAASGLIPDPQWREETFVGPGYTAIDRDWQPGYDITMSIGQGDLLVSPMQLATAYSALANGGRLVTPHVADEIRDSADRLVKRIEPKPQRNLHLSPIMLDEIKRGLYAASHSASGTSTAVFGTFTPAIAGKTGTAEVYGKADNAWYAAWAPLDDPEIVVVAVIVGGGHGGVSAAPVAREVLQAYFHPNTRLVAVKGVDSSN